MIKDLMKTTVIAAAVLGPPTIAFLSPPETSVLASVVGAYAVGPVGAFCLSAPLCIPVEMVTRSRNY